ncbi:MAG: hypothetical protein FJ104_01930 [Deltaproteobacteria bacterium]|nr:hypothetical protein [Deltaproteobacteria bacterium]
MSLGLPALVERLTWKTFVKVFHRDPGGSLRGWNVRLVQRGLDGPLEPRLRRGVPVAFGHYRVVTGEAVPGAPPGALLLDYGLGGNAPWDPVSRLRDPLVSLGPGAPLLGTSLVAVGARLVRTPSYFLLEDRGRLELPIVSPPRSPRPGRGVGL